MKQYAADSISMKSDIIFAKNYLASSIFSATLKIGQRGVMCGGTVVKYSGLSFM